MSGILVICLVSAGAWIVLDNTAVILAIIAATCFLERYNVLGFLSLGGLAFTFYMVHQGRQSLRADEKARELALREEKQRTEETAD